MTTGLDQVYETKVVIIGQFFFGLCQTSVDASNLCTNINDVVEPATDLAVLNDCCGQITLPTESPKRCMAWKGWVHRGLATYLTLQWKVAQFLDKGNILLKKCFGSPCYFHLIWREACFSQCLTPSEPVSGYQSLFFIPVSPLNRRMPGDLPPFSFATRLISLSMCWLSIAIATTPGF